jgi:hypothetical protein
MWRCVVAGLLMLPLLAAQAQDDATLRRARGGAGTLPGRACRLCRPLCPQRL